MARADKPAAIPLATPIKGDIRGGLVGTWCIALVNAAFLVLVGKAMDDVLNDRALGLTLLALVALVVARGLIGWYVPVRGAKAASVLEVDMRDRVFRSVMAQGAPVRSQEQTGRVVATGTQSVELSSTFYATFLGPIIGSMTTPLVVLVVIGVFIDVRTALTLAVIVVLIPRRGLCHVARRRLDRALLRAARGGHRRGAQARPRPVLDHGKNRKTVGAGTSR